MNRTPGGDHSDRKENVSCNPIPLIDLFLPPFYFNSNRFYGRVDENIITGNGKLIESWMLFIEIGPVPRAAFDGLREIHLGRRSEAEKPLELSPEVQKFFG